MHAGSATERADDLWWSASPRTRGDDHAVHEELATPDSHGLAAVDRTRQASCTHHARDTHRLRLGDVVGVVREEQSHVRRAAVGAARAEGSEFLTGRAKVHLASRGTMQRSRHRDGQSFPLGQRHRGPERRWRRRYWSIDRPASDTGGSVGGPALRLAGISEEAAAEMWVARGGPHLTGLAESDRERL